MEHLRIESWGGTWLRRRVGLVLAAAGASWAVCAPLDVGTDPEAVEMVAEAAAGCR